MPPTEPLAPISASSDVRVPVNAVMIVFAVTTYAPAGTVMLVTRSSWLAGWFSGPALRTCS